MRKMVAMLLIAVLFFTGCVKVPAGSLIASDESSLIQVSSAVSQHETSEANSIQFNSLPARVEVVKDDAYYENLLAQVDSHELWPYDTLEKNLEYFAKELLDYYDDKNINTTSELTPEEMFFFTRFHDTEADDQSHIYYNSDESEFFIHETIVEKYIYYYFNVKVDCSTFENYDWQHGGLREYPMGYENSYDSELVRCQDQGEGLYEVTLRYRYWESEDDSYIGSMAYVIKVEDNRLYLVSMKSKPQK